MFVSITIRQSELAIEEDFLNEATFQFSCCWLGERPIYTLGVHAALVLLGTEPSELAMA